MIRQLALSALLLMGCDQPLSEPTEPDRILCQHEDGSGDQAFPCYWDSGPNGLGDSYWLSAPADEPMANNGDFEPDPDIEPLPPMPAMPPEMTQEAPPPPAQADGCS